MRSLPPSTTSFSNASAAHRLWTAEARECRRIDTVGAGHCSAQAPADESGTFLWEDAGRPHSALASPAADADG